MVGLKNNVKHAENIPHIYSWTTVTGHCKDLMARIHLLPTGTHTLQITFPGVGIRQKLLVIRRANYINIWIVLLMLRWSFQIDRTEYMVGT